MQKEGGSKQFYFSPDNDKFTIRKELKKPRSVSPKNQKEQLIKYELPNSDEYPVKSISSLGMGDTEDAYPSVITLEEKVKQNIALAS